jgi:5-methylcytosine-specific restriction endonuclease McrA
MEVLCIGRKTSKKQRKKHTRRSVAQMNLTKPQRAILRMKFGGKCAYCGEDLPEKGWHADHVEPVLREWWKNTPHWKEAHGFTYNVIDGKVVRASVEIEKAGLTRPQNDTPDNLFPACRPCNIDKHASSLEAWRSQMQDRVGVCRRNYSAFRHAERFGLIQEIKKPVVFWFETYLLSATTEAAGK